MSKSLYLMHHGIKGQKWGVRRYQNEDGSLTDDGRKHYGLKDSYGRSSRSRGRKALDILDATSQYGKERRKNSVSKKEAKKFYDQMQKEMSDVKMKDIRKAQNRDDAKRTIAWMTASGATGVAISALSTGAAVSTAAIPGLNMITAASAAGIVGGGASMVSNSSRRKRRSKAMETLISNS